MKNSGIGGQAVMEGIMMRNGDDYAVAVRTPDNKIVVDKKKHVSFTKRHKWAAIPIIRGVIAFAESLYVGVNTLMYSSSFFEEEEPVKKKDSQKTKMTKEEREKEAKKKERQESLMMGLTMLFALVITLALFMVIPYIISNVLGGKIESEAVLALIEGGLRLLIFVLYVVAISQMKEIKRVFCYHGAEHKSINCIENGLPLTVENVRKQSREHKRCGTSFLLYVMIISVIFFLFIRVSTPWLRILFRLLLIPVIAGVAYEFIKLAGRSNSKVMNVLSRPGFWVQRLTTAEPDDAMIEVAIASVEAVFDWREFLGMKEEAEEKKDTAKKTSKKGKKKENAVQSKKEEPKGMDDEAFMKKDETIAATADAESKKAEDDKEKEVKASSKKDEDSKKSEASKKSEDSKKKEASKKKESSEKEDKEEAAVVHKATVLRTGTRGHGAKRTRTFLDELNQMGIPEEKGKPERRLGQEDFEDEEDDELLSALDRYFEEK